MVTGIEGLMARTVIKDTDEIPVIFYFYSLFFLY